MKGAIKATDYVITFLCILGKVKLEMEKTDQWLPGTGTGGGAGYKRAQGFFCRGGGNGTVFYFDCGSGFMTIYLLKLVHFCTKKDKFYCM